MRLKSLWVDGFKNLNDFKIEFDEVDGITVLIGNNASGKSNVLEAISAIFYGLYASIDNRNINNPERYIHFDFKLIYDINNHNILIYYQKGEFSLTISEYENTEKTIQSSFHDVDKNQWYKYLPTQIIALYSGEELRLWENYYKNFYINFFNDLKNQNNYNLKMLYINKYVWNIALISLLCNKKSSKFIKDILDINPQDGLDVNFKIDNSRYKNYKNNNALQLVKRIEIEQKEKEWINTKTLGSFDIGNQQIEPKEIFEYLYIISSPTTKNKRVKIDKIITNIKIKISEKPEIFLVGLSEGQKKQILLKLALDVLADDNSLLLFDEPDAHIHINNKKLIPDMLLKEFKDKRNVVLTTHSPTLAHSFNTHNLRYLDNGKIDENYNEKEQIINNLSSGFMGVSETQILLQSNKDILIVEGKTDEGYISQALEILKQNNDEYKDLDFNFLWLGGSDSDNFNKIIDNLTPKENQTIIAFFDRDSSGKECIKKILNKDIQDDFDGEVKNNINIYLYPKKPDFGNSNFEVEDYFPIEVLRDYIVKSDSKNFQSLKAKFNKNKFAEHCKTDDFNKSNFDGFKTLFDKILEIKNS
jgi:ABC-type cobalamin/Fe3+-siderophores transport system ATPase subunit